MGLGFYGWHTAISPLLRQGFSNFVQSISLASMPTILLICLSGSAHLTKPIEFRTFSIYFLCYAFHWHFIVYNAIYLFL
jgi:hypothetical protein